MILLTALPSDRLDRLRAAVDGTHEVVAASDWEHVTILVRGRPVDVIVVDPCFSVGEPDAAPILAIRARYKSVPFVVYSVLAPGTAGALAMLGRAGFEHVVLDGLDDEPWRLREVLASQPGVALAAQLLERLQPVLRPLPADVLRAVERLIHTPAAFHGVPDLADAAGVSRRTIYREFERAHLASPREVIAAARVLRAYAILREPNRAIEDVVDSLRFSSAHHLTRTMRWACGMTTARARERIAPQQLIELLAERIRVAPEGAPGDAEAGAP